MDYTGLYEDLLAMERRATDGEFKLECFAFRCDILLLCRTLVARVWV